jgi:flagellar FliL protein
MRRAQGAAPAACPEYLPLVGFASIQDKFMAAKAKKAEVESEVEAEVEGAEGAPSTSKFKLPPLKTMLIAAAAVLLLSGGGAAAYFYFSSPKDEKQASGPGKPAVFVDVPDVLVNLSNTGSDRTQYLKVKVVLEVLDQALAQQITPLMPRVMDAFQTYLRELRPTDLDGSAGLYRLKEELTRRVNAAVAPNRINAVLFKEIVVQ